MQSMKYQPERPKRFLTPFLGPPGYTATGALMAGWGS